MMPPRSREGISGTLDVLGKKGVLPVDAALPRDRIVPRMNQRPVERRNHPVSRRSTFTLGLLLAGGLAMSQAAATPSGAPTGNAPPVAKQDAAAAHGGNPVCEVEIKGDIQHKGPLPANTEWFVYVAQNDCMAKDAHVVAVWRMGTSGKFFVEAFAKWGADVTVCAAAAAGPDQPSTLYGRAKRSFHLAKTGEIEIDHVIVPVKTGPQKTFPQARPAL